MKEHLRKTIEILKKRVQHNLKIIHDNEKNVRNILQEPVSSSRSERLDEKFNINKRMLEENNDSIKIQLSIIRFLDKFSKELEDYIEKLEAENKENNIAQNSTEERNDYEVDDLSRDDYFELTIHNSIEFDHKHPYFDDEEFFNQLLEYYTSIENYEMCSKLILSNKKNDAFSNN